MSDRKSYPKRVFLCTADDEGLELWSTTRRNPNAIEYVLRKDYERLQAECHKYHVNINGLQTELDDAKAELEATKKRADANGDHARLANENMGAIAKSLKVERAENERLREALEKAQGELINLQPHIPQACKPGHESFIDTYVDKALLVIEEALKGFESE